MILVTGDRVFSAFFLDELLGGISMYRFTKLALRGYMGKDGSEISTFQ